MRSSVHFILDGRETMCELGPPGGLDPTTTVLHYLRALPGHRGVKEGCAEGDCGACTVVLAAPVNGRLHYRAVDSCLLFLPMIDGQHLITVENLRSPSGELHPVQEAMVRSYGSQCGFCTPGLVMSMFALYQERPGASEEEIRSVLAGNLCRCTGYRSVIDACAEACHRAAPDQFTRDAPRILHILNTLPQEPLEVAAGTTRYYRPIDLQQALHYLVEHPGALVIAGATDVALGVTKNHKTPETLLDVSAVEALQVLWEEDGCLVIGAGVPLCRVLEFARGRVPALQTMLEVFAAKQIRNVGTIGGNLATASPVGDLLPVLIAHEAIVAVEGPGGERRVPAGDFVTGYRRTALAPGELITKVMVPLASQGTLLRAYKVSRRKDVDISTVSGCFRLDVSDDARIRRSILAYGGMADRPRRASETEAFLEGKPWNRSTVEQAMQVVDADFAPISDVRGSAEFRRVAARNLLLKFWDETRTD